MLEESQEITVASFDLDNRCGIVPGTESADYVPMRLANTQETDGEYEP